MSEQRGSRKHIELTCAGCGQVVSCDCNGFGYIATELVANDELGFGALISGLIVAAWEFEVSQILVDDLPRVTVVARPESEFGKPRPDIGEMTAVWMLRPGGWINDAVATGIRPTSRREFRPVPAKLLARMVTAHAPSWALIAKHS
ncbi:hypothetical protein [Nocardia lijiangensis]|uniref:hypothetical protein n=1 Tax=Nocardia lijiangensis TaxID=299618 RepID=UPI00082CB097|nr:hypothetical protein [Nocardia lijiangensis]